MKGLQHFINAENKKDNNHHHSQTGNILDGTMLHEPVLDGFYERFHCLKGIPDEPTTRKRDRKQETTRVGDLNLNLQPDW